MKEPPLVSQYLERISREAVERYRPLLEAYVRRRQGVYALYKKNKLYYVGLAGDLRWRLRQHLKDHHGHSWDRFSVYLTIGEKHLKELETLILHITWKPRGNEQKGRFKQSENLKRTLQRDIKRHQHAELLALMGRDVEVKKPRLSKRRDQRHRPILSRYIRGPFRIRGVLNGRIFKARVRRDGSIRFKGKIYDSPSAAGGAATRGACNGWYFWTYQRAPSDWVRLRELRK